MTIQSPLWLAEIADFVAVHPQIVLSGNTRDIFLLPGRDGTGLRLAWLREAIWSRIAPLGFKAMLVWDRVDRVQTYPDSAEAVVRRFLIDECGLAPEANGGLPPVAAVGLGPVLKRLAGRSAERIAVAIDYAARLDGGLPVPPETTATLFAAAEKLSHEARPVGSAESETYNPIFWIVDQPSDLPGWFLRGNHKIRSLVLPKPDFETRREAARLIAETFADAAQMEPARLAQIVDGFANLTQDMALTAMLAMGTLAERRGLAFGQIDKAVQLFKIGIIEDPWRSPDMHARVVRAESEIGRRVKGQTQAIRKTADILRRAVIGLNGAQFGGASSGRPKGTLFLAGPTGTGKTELAKALSELVFGNERAYLRFDMSEFSAEHSEARLIGAPPGYVGFDAGGELTRGIRERPFSVVLFDEIEKAHPRLLDKFLQILDDGRLTDGHGETAYFSQAIIVFTSNLGVTCENPERPGEGIPAVHRGAPYEEVERTIRAGISDYFKNRLRRPELLNRFGDNIVVFNFIEDPIADQIFEKGLANVTASARAACGIELVFAPEVQEMLRARCRTRLDEGGRGILNQMDPYLVEPLSRALFERGTTAGERITVTALVEDADGRRVELAG